MIVSAILEVFLFCKDYRVLLKYSNTAHSFCSLILRIKHVTLLQGNFWWLQEVITRFSRIEILTILAMQDFIYYYSIGIF